MKKAISYKFIYTLGIILLVRLVAHIPVPWVDAELMQSASTYTFLILQICLVAELLVILLLEQ